MDSVRDYAAYYCAAIPVCFVIIIFAAEMLRISGRNQVRLVRLKDPPKGSEPEPLIKLDKSGE